MHAQDLHKTTASSDSEHFSMANLTIGEVVDLVTDGDSGESDIEEDPSFPLPRESSSENDESENEELGKAFNVYIKQIH